MQISGAARGAIIGPNSSALTALVTDIVAFAHAEGDAADGPEAEENAETPQPLSHARLTHCHHRGRLPAHWTNRPLRTRTHDYYGRRRGRDIGTGRVAVAVAVV